MSEKLRTSERCFLGGLMNFDLRKGKEFVKIKTNLTETINHLFVEENMIWTGGEYILNIYDNCKDFGFVMIKDRINDLTCAPIYPGEILSTVVACRDKCLRVFQGEKAFHEFSVEGSATAIGFHGPNPVDVPNGHHVGDPVQMIYGTEQGVVGLCSLVWYTTFVKLTEPLRSRNKPLLKPKAPPQKERI